MASIITVKIGYDDNSKSYTETFPCADSHPSAEVVKQCETDTLDKWIAMGGSVRSLKTDIKVRQT